MRNSFGRQHNLDRDGLPVIANVQWPSNGRPGVYYLSSGASTGRGAAVLCFFAAAVALLPAAASLPDSRSCDCESAVLLERQRLQAEHTRSVQALEKTYESRITQLEGLVAALGGNAAARDAAPDLARLPRAQLAPDILTGRAEGARPTRAAAGLGELRKSASSRALLQTEKFCSMDELMSVQKDAAAAVTGMLATNLGCAMCLIPCASAENVLGCAMACVKQVPPPNLQPTQCMHCVHGTLQRTRFHRA